MSLEKSKQLKKFSRLPENKKYEALQFKTPLHAEAEAFRISVFNGFWLKNHPDRVPIEQRKWVDYHYQNAVSAFEKRFMEACNRRDGKFFHALGDVIEHHAKNPEWSDLERFIYAQCSICRNMREPLPSAGQLLRSWKLKCGLVPSRSNDLRLLWKFLFTDPIPSQQAVIEKRLRPFIGKSNPTVGEIQIGVIQRTARNLGFRLPKQKTRNCLPAGVMVI
jgi:hypothetical protein